MPEEIKAVETVTTETKPEPTPQQAARDAVNKQYEQYYGAPNGQAQETTQEAAPVEQPAAETVVSTDTAAPAPTVEEILTRALAPVVDKIRELETKLSTPTQQVTQAAPVSTEPAKSWIDFVREGKFDEAENLIIDKAINKIRSTVTEQSTSDAVTRVRAEEDIRRFVDDIETKNQDLAEAQPWIVAEAKARIDAANAAGKIKSIEDYVTAYKGAVTESVDTVRKAVQKFRGSGKQEAMTVRKEVISTGVVPSASPAENAEQKQKSEEPEANRPLDYIARRQNSQAAGRGLF